MLILNKARYNNDVDLSAAEIFDDYISTENKWGFDPDNYCTHNNEGPMCQLCKRGYYKSGGRTPVADVFEPFIQTHAKIFIHNPQHRRVRKSLQNLSG